MKKCLTIFFITIFIIVFSSQEAICTDGGETASQGVDTSGAWVTDAFSAVKSFLTGEVTDYTGMGSTILDVFTDIVKAINRILWIVLASVSAIALAMIGIRYIRGINDPVQLKKAKDSLPTVFSAMLYGFGAFFIWRIAMGFVTLIIGTFGS